MYIENRKEISTVFDQQNTGFVLLPSGKKFPPDRAGWEKRPYSFQEAQKERGDRNIGIIVPSGYIILDVDDPSALAGLELPKSTKWETRPGRYATWFKCDDCVGPLVERRIHASKSKLILYDSRKLDKNSRYPPVGEIKLRRTYQVIPPSWKEVETKRTKYMFMDGGEIAPRLISLQWLFASLWKNGISLSSKPSSKGTQAQGTGKNETHPKKISAGDGLRKLAVIESERSSLLDTQEGDRNNQLNRSAFLLACAGIDYRSVLDTLLPVARSIGLDAMEIVPTITSGFLAGREQWLKEEGEGKRGEEREVEPSRFIEKGKVIPKRVADDILGEFTIRTRSGDHQIFFYDDGIYNPNGGELIRNEVEKRLGEASNNHIKNEVLGHIRDTTLTDPSEFNSQKSLIHLGNGIFDLDQMKLREFDKDIISTTKLPVRYVEDADCPKFKEFLGQILTPGDASLIQEVFGWCLIKNYRFQKVVMCVGSGSNGKSTLLEVLKEFLGRDNIASIPLQQLARRFTPSQLFGKLANIYPDLPSGAFRETGVFKVLTGGDQISAEVKYIPNFLNFVNYAKLIFSTNKIPETLDESDAFFRRWLLVNFPNVFEGDEADTLLSKKIMTAEELSGIFNWSIVGSRRLIERGGFEYRETEKVRDQYRRMSSSLLAFVEDCVEVAGNEEWISKEEFYNTYIRYCKAERLPTKAKNVVGRELAEHVSVQGGKKRTKEGQVRVWRGIKLLPPVSW